MTGSFAALLRAVNVGGTGRLAMSDLRAICEAAGFQAVRTYIASGNVVFRSKLDEPQVKFLLEARLHAHAGRPVGAIIRTAAELAGILAQNPFADSPPNRVMTIFLDEAPSPALLDDVTGRAPHEELRLGRREIYVHYGAGMARTTLRIPAAARGTARNINTVAALAALSAA